MVARILAYLGGLFAIVSGLVSAATQKPMIYYIAGTAPLSGSPLIATGIIAVIGGLLVFYGTSKNNPGQVIIGGILGLIAPCILSILAVIGGLMLRGQARSPG